MRRQAYDKKKASEAKARKAAKEAEAARAAEMDLLYKGAPKKDDRETEKTAKQVRTVQVYCIPCGARSGIFLHARFSGVV